MVIKTKPSGYSKVAMNLAQRIRDKHQIAHQPMLRSNQMGLFVYQNLLVYPSGSEEFGEDVIEKNYLHFNADAVLTLKDLYVFGKLFQLPLEVISYVPVDGTPIGVGVSNRLRYAFRAISMSEFGEKELNKIGVKNTLIHHGVGEEYKRSEDKQACRRRFHIKPDEFVIGFVGLNTERKNVSRVLEIIRETRDMNPDVDVKGFLWTNVDKEVPLRGEIIELALNEHVHWPNPEMYDHGLPEENMIELYNTFDCTLCVLPETLVNCNPILKQISEISTGDKVLTHSGNYERVNRVFKKNYNGKIKEISTLYNTIPVKLTPEHLVLAIKKRIPNPRLKQYQEVMELRKKGLGNVTISKKLGISVGNVSNWLYMGFKPINWKYQISYKHKMKGIKTNPSWLFAEELEKGDVLLYPIIKEKDMQTFKVSDYVKNITIKDENVYAQGRNQFGTTFIHPQCKSIKNIQELDETLLKIFGFYVAEGCSSSDQIIFSFGTFENEYIEEIKRLMKQKFNLDAGITNNTRNRTRVVFSNSILARLFTQLFGRGARNKKLPSWIIGLSTTKLSALIEALWKGDGHKYQYTTTSSTLAHQIFDVLLRLGIISSISHVTRGEYIIYIIKDLETRKRFKTLTTLKLETNSKKGTYKHGWLSEEYLFMPIRSIKEVEYNGTVYDLEVPNSDTFVSSFIIHNCVGNEGFWLPGAESLACGVPLIVPDYAAAADRVGPGCGYKVKITEYTRNNPVAIRQPLVDVSDAARKITRIINGDRERYARQCIKEAEKYRWNKIIEKGWLPFLEECEIELCPKLTSKGITSWANEEVGRQ